MPNKMKKIKFSFHDLALSLLGDIDKYITSLRIIYTVFTLTLICLWIFADDPRFIRFSGGNYESLNLPSFDSEFALLFFLFVFAWVIYVWIGRSRRNNGPRIINAAIAMLLASFIVTSIIWLLICLFLYISLPDNNRLVPETDLATNLYFTIVALAWLMLLFGVRRKFPWTTIIMWLSGFISVASWFSILSFTSILLIDRGKSLAASLMISIICFFWGVGAALFVYQKGSLTGETKMTVATPANSPKDVTIDAKPYLSSARQMALVVILLFLISFDVAFSHLGRVQALQNLRRNFALPFAAMEIGHLSQSASESEQNQLWNGWRRIDSSTSKSRSGVKEWVVVNSKFVEGIGKLTIAFLFRSNSENAELKARRLKVQVSEGLGPWTVYKDLSKSGKPRSAQVIDLQEFLRAQSRNLSPCSISDSNDYCIQPLKEIAFKWNIEIPDTTDPPILEDFIKIYRLIDLELAGKEVSLPTVAIGVKSHTAMWWLTIAIVIFIILIRNRLRAAFRDPKYGREEPWLILDNCVGVERWLSGAWLISILVSPWIAGSMLLMTVYGQDLADGVRLPPALVLPRLVSLFLIPIIGGWIAATSVAMLLQLRRERLT